MERPLLAIDTSTLMASVAVVCGGEVLAAQTQRVREGHGESLAPLVASVCASARLRARDLGGVAVGIGPGTFTGLRVGLATAKGIAVVHQLPLIGVSSLAAMAHHLRGVVGETAPPSLCIVPMLDARRAEVYAAAYDGAGNELLPEQACPAQALARTLRSWNRPCLCGGEGWLRYRDIVAHVLGDELTAPDTAIHGPSATAVAALARARLVRGEHDDLHRLVPHYVRASYALANEKAPR